MGTYIRGTGKPRKGMPAPPDQPPSQAQIDIFFHHLTNDFEPKISVAAAAAGINRKHFDDLCKTDAEFRRRLKEWQDWRLDDVEDVLLRRAADGDVAAARAVLAAKRPEVYGAKAKLDITHSIRSPEDLKALSDEEFAALEAECLGNK